MTDPFESLRPPRRPMSAGSDLQVVARGRRLQHRRRVAYGGIVGAGLVAVGAVTVLGSSHDKQDSVGVLDPDLSASPSAEPTPSASPSPKPDPLPSLITVTELLPPPIGSNPSPDATTTPDAADSTPPPRGSFIGSEPTAAGGGPVVTRTTSTDASFCAVGAQQQPPYNPGGWCGAVSGPSQVVAGHRATYSVKVCRRVDQGVGTLHFDTRLEMFLQVVFYPTSGGDPTVMWYAGDPAALPADPHTVTVPAGDCVTWSTTWSGQDLDGYAVGDTTYELDGAPYASDFFGDNADYPPPIGTIAVSVSYE